MTDIKKVEDIFFHNTNLSKENSLKILNNSLNNTDDGEIFFEYNESESFVFDDGVLRNSNFNIRKGFGLRSVLGEITGYAHSSELTDESLKRAAKTVEAVKNGYSGKVNIDGQILTKTNQQLYTDSNPLKETGFNTKIELLNTIDKYLRDKNPFVKQVSASLSGEWQVVGILKNSGEFAGDIRPLVRLNISVVVEKNGRMERGSHGTGGREIYKNFIVEKVWKEGADEALRQALVNLDSVAAPAGKMPVVLGNGWPGILLHEAVGHGLEGDFNRKKTSAFSGLLGQQVAAKGVTVVDDGTIHDRRGSLTIDDEGTPSQHTVLIEDGILKGYMQDRMNARLMGVKPTGNGRRESFEYAPLPRMTNTYMLGGDKTQEEIIASVKKGVYAPNFGGGQVDITSGKFVFSASEAYLIENGKITAPVKGVTLAGNGPESLKNIKMIGNDMKLDPGIGTCGKAGQGVPVGVGQPTVLIEGLTVGGTSA